MSGGCRSTGAPFSACKSTWRPTLPRARPSARANVSVAASAASLSLQALTGDACCVCAHATKSAAGAAASSAGAGGGGGGGGGGGFQMVMRLSDPLSAMLGGKRFLTRPQCLKLLWQYVNDHKARAQLSLCRSSRPLALMLVRAAPGGQADSLRRGHAARVWRAAAGGRRHHEQGSRELSSAITCDHSGPGAQSGYCRRCCRRS